MKHLVHRLTVISLAALLLFTNSAYAQEVTQADTGSEASVIIYEHTIGRGLTHEFTIQDIPSSGNFTDVDNLASNIFIGDDNIVVTTKILTLPGIQSCSNRRAFTIWLNVVLMTKLHLMK